MHVKDEIAVEKEKGEMNGNYESTILGKGLVGVKEIIEWAKKRGGMRHFILEQESYEGKPPLDCMRENLQVMKNRGIEFTKINLLLTFTS